MTRNTAAGRDADTGPTTARDADTGPAVQSARGLYAYAITSVDDLDLADVPTIGSSADTPHLIRQGDIALVASDIALSVLDDLTADDVTDNSKLARLARTHDSAVRAVAAQTSVLPLRFGTVVTDADAAIRLLRSRHDEARRLLSHVDGCQEWGVRLRVESPAGPSPGQAGQPGQLGQAGQPPRSGTAYLAQRKKARAEKDHLEARRHTWIQTAHDTLRTHARDSAARVARGPGVLWDAAYLVARSGEAEFFASVEQLAQRLRTDALAGLEVETSGPWPPYSFAHMEGETADA